MLNPLGQELTAEERQVEAALRHALLVLDKRSSLASIRAIAAQNPEEFVAAALGMLESKSDPAVRQKLYMDLLEGTEFFAPLASVRPFDRTRHLEVCRGLKGIDDLVDVRLAQLAPRRHENPYGLTPEIVLRLLDILHVISPHPG